MFILSISFSFILIAFVDIEGMWEHLLFHSSIEAGGATVAIMLAIMLLTVDTFHSNEKYILFGIAFLGMGILDGVHAVLSPGHEFVFFHSVASLLGSFIFVLVWFKNIQSIVLKYKKTFVLSILLTVTIISLFLSNELVSYIPDMLDKEKKFTDEAILINFVAGVLFLLTSLKLLLDYLKYDSPDDFIFFALTLFFGIAEVIFNSSSLWQYEWWLWHFLRLFSYLLVLYFIALEIQKQKSILNYQAHHDSLTGLPNRTLFTDRLVHSVEKAKRNNTQFAVLFLDLDNFKNINDSYGHHFGDEILKITTQRLNGLVRMEDTVSRLGGDEFTIIMGDLTSGENASVLARKILDKFSSPIQIEDRTLHITTSIGISTYPEDARNTQDLIKFADTAMYKSKDEGRNKFQFYNSKMTKEAARRVDMEASFREALKNEDFIVYYQPQIDASKNELIGMEALVRWNHSTKGLIPPYKFLPLAEETGLIIDLDRFVMKTAMKQFSRWYSQGFHPGTLSMNLAVQQLQKEDFISVLEDLFEKTACKAEWIELEITEGEIMLNPEQSIHRLNEISDMNIKLSIDDFGTGYSSLAYLKKLPIDKLKIDRTFIKDLSYDEDDKAIVKAIIALAKNLNLEIIAEGVELEVEKDFLLANDCHNIQGYLYAKPMPCEEIEKMLTYERINNFNI